MCRAIFKTTRTQNVIYNNLVRERKTKQNTYKKIQSKERKSKSTYYKTGNISLVRLISALCSQVHEHKIRG